MGVISDDDTGNNSYNNLKSIPIWKIYISHTFPQALGVSRRTFDSNNLCQFLVRSYATGIHVHRDVGNVAL